jgi:hypothetical protein
MMESHFDDIERKDSLPTHDEQKQPDTYVFVPNPELEKK